MALSIPSNPRRPVPGAPCLPGGVALPGVGFGVVASGVIASAFLALALPHAASAAEQAKCGEDIVVKADNFEADYKSNTTQLRNVVISQCDIRVEAKHARATGLSFDNTRWTLDGDVHINVEKRGNLKSDLAVIDFKNGQISKATITGKPAEFEQRRSDSDAIAHGKANEIVYDVTGGTVKLSTEAWLSDGRTEIKGPQIVYNIIQQQVQGSTQSSGGERVRITITPNAPPKITTEKKDPAKEPAKTPADDATKAPADGAAPAPGPKSP
ncbi:MAG TPA: lipopolysaccharide transport periplasmic protein LptA [Steroidobacteraceae bacterium]|nr:lipopolysaccharide transport periplasmic protein LptA [Steroidobacteraceae bacterium]